MAPKAKAKSEAPKAAAPVEGGGLTPEQELAELEKRIAVDQARAEELRFRINFAEFPKMVKGRTFASRAEQDAAGPEFAD